MRSRVLLTRRIPSSLQALLSEHHDVDLYDGRPPIPYDELKRRLSDKDALVAAHGDNVDREALSGASALRIVANIGVGYDNIDVSAAQSRGVIVTNTPGVLTEAVAEFTWALILGIARRIAEGDRLIRAGRWKGGGLDFMLGTELRGKQLGIIGAGRIGRAVAAKAPAFGMTVVFGSSRSAPESDRVSVDELLISSDVISVHTPLTPATRHLIDRRAFARMKRSALFVNTSRGPVVDEEALAWALNEHLIAGAALDVYEREPEVHAALLGFENVLLLPHLGSATRETRSAMIELAIRNVLAVLDGREALTPV